MSWVWEQSRAEPIDRLVLLAIADCTNDLGTDAYPSIATLVTKTGLHARSVQRSIRHLIEIGELEVEIGGGHLANRYRVTMTPGTVPPLPPAERHPRQSATPGTPPPLERQSATPGVAERHPNRPKPVMNPRPKDSSSTATPTTVAKPERPEVEHLCKLLADAIEANGSKRPTVTQGWRDAARLLLDKDGRTAEQVARAIAWSQGDEFWRSNILSMPTLRRQYDRLRLAAQRGHSSNGHRESTTDQRVAQTLALAADLERREAAQ